MVCAILSAAGFGTLPVLYKLGYSMDMPKAGMLAWRFAGAGAALVLYCWVTGLSLRVDRLTLVRLVVLGGAGYSGQCWLYSTAMAHIEASLGTMLFFVYPVATALFAAPILGERLDGDKVRAMALSMAGCLLIVLGPGADGVLGGFNVTGVSLALASGIGYAAYTIAARRIVKSVHPVVLSTYITLSCAAFYALAMLAAGGPWAPSGPGEWAIAGLLSVWATVIPMISLMWALDLIGATLSSTLGTFELVVSSGLAVVFLRERVQWVQVAGGVLILASVFLVQRGIEGRIMPKSGE